MKATSALEEKAASSEVAKLFLEVELNDLDDGKLSVFFVFEMVIVSFCFVWVMNLREICTWAFLRQTPLSLVGSSMEAFMASFMSLSSMASSRWANADKDDESSSRPATVVGFSSSTTIALTSAALSETFHEIENQSSAFQ